MEYMRLEVPMVPTAPQSTPTTLPVKFGVLTLVVAFAFASAWCGEGCFREDLLLVWTLHDGSRLSVKVPRAAVDGQYRLRAIGDPEFAVFSGPAIRSVCGERYYRGRGILSRDSHDSPLAQYTQVKRWLARRKLIFGSIVIGCLGSCFLAIAWLLWPWRISGSGTVGHSFGEPEFGADAQSRFLKGRIGKSAYYMDGLATSMFLLIASGLFVLFVHLGDLAALAFLAASIFVPFVMPLPVYAVSCHAKRLHDLGMSGYNLMLVYIPVANVITDLLISVTPGTSASNQYGMPASRRNQLKGCQPSTGTREPIDVGIRPDSNDDSCDDRKYAPPGYFDDAL